MDNANNANFKTTALANCIGRYLNSKNAKDGVEYNSFFVVIIRMLVIIYDELDIVMPYNFGDEELIKSNLSKYGYEYQNLMGFLSLIERYTKTPNNSDYITIEKMLIDMLGRKKRLQDITQEEIAEFRKLVSSPEACNPLIISDNFLMTNDPYELINYFDKAMIDNQKQVIVKAKELLNLGAYQLLNYSLDDINAMTAEQVDEINKQVYAHFEIKETAMNKKYLLDKAVYDLTNPKPTYSTGNGFVDILFFLSILATISLVLAVVSILLH